MDVLARLALVLALASLWPGPQPPGSSDTIYVDPSRGDDRSAGTRERPLRTLSAAVDNLPDPVERTTSILLAGGAILRSEAKDSAGTLNLARRMRPGVSVRIAPEVATAMPILAWNSAGALVEVGAGSWRIEHVQVGTNSAEQRRGVVAVGPGTITLEDVSFRLRSKSDYAIVAQRGGRVVLSGAIRINDPPPEGDESFSGMRAVDCGIIEFESDGRSSLVLGNGNLTTSYWGSIRLGCDTASITCATRSNCLSVGNSGRIDLRNTRTTLVARDPKNTPIGLEDDGHILGEDAHVLIRGENDSAIALQKRSALFCNDVELQGQFGHALWASSGSIFVGSFVGDVGHLEASTGASIHVERVRGKVVGPIEAKSGGVVSLPDSVVTSK